MIEGGLDKTEESIFTLLSLFVLISQAYESLLDDENVFTAEFSILDRNSFEDLKNDTIREALVYQILIKSCSFMDEWNTIFGIRTEQEDQKQILALKAIAKPATQNIKAWSGLKEFRNHFIAHNFRNKKGKNVFLADRSYNSPQSDAEIYLLILSMRKMMDLIKHFFPTKVFHTMIKSNNGYRDSSPSLTDVEITERIKKLDSIDLFLQSKPEI